MMDEDLTRLDVAQTSVVQVGSSFIGFWKVAKHFGCMTMKVATKSVLHVSTDCILIYRNSTNLLLLRCSTVGNTVAVCYLPYYYWAVWSEISTIAFLGAIMYECRTSNCLHEKK